MKRGPRRGLRPARPANVVCFGMIIPSLVLVVDRFPAHNTGALITRVQEIIEDDAAIIARVLRGWNVRSALVGTALGDDARGRETARKLKCLGVLGRVRLSKSFATPHEIDVSDATGHRTYFWQREPQVLDTLDTADLRFLQGAQFLYVDWYDGDHIVRAMDEANRLGVPVFLNIEDGHRDPRLLKEYVGRAHVVQGCTDAAQHRGDPFAVAQTLLDAGAKTALVTLASEGCLAATRGETWRAAAPQVEVIDGCGAGASFSAGFMYGQMHRWSLERSVQFAIAAGSYKCTQVGLDTIGLDAVKKMARTVRVERVGSPS